MGEEIIGKVTDYFAKIGVAGIQITAGFLSVGDTIHIKGHTTDLELTVQSMQINNANVTAAKAGDSVGIKLPDRARHGDKVYKVTG